MSYGLGVADIKFSSSITTEWDEERGQLVRITDIVGSKTREVIEVRARLEEQITRAAVIKELERIGYTVTSPEA